MSEACLETAPEAEAPTGGEKPPKKKWRPVLIAALALAVLIAGWLFFHFSYVRAVNRYMTVTLHGDLAQIRSLAPDEYWDLMETALGVDLDEYFGQIEDTFFTELQNELRPIYGDNIETSWKLGDSALMDEAALSVTRTHIGDAYGISESRITALRRVDVTVTLSGEIKTEEQTVPLYVIKIDGNWYVCDLTGEFLSGGI